MQLYQDIVLSMKYLTAIANDSLGSIDINRGDTLLGWDTDSVSK